MAEGTHHEPCDSEIRDALEVAVSRVWRSRFDLVSQGASERTVVTRIAFELEPIAQAWSPRWRADVEYNLRHHQSGILKKVLYVHDGTAPRERSVYPDLILHDPVDQEGSNLLVLEAKRGRPTPKARRHDLAKLQAYVQHLGYRHAVYLEFDGRGGPPRIHWLQSDGQLEAPRTPGRRVSPAPRQRRAGGPSQGAAGALF
ncbi:hypothetical protein [Streptacidiphilus sp. MAP5-52]|uniref:hypothetical protein n=1 Tax=Streptacidiphilus sp. MAP5-52 TaxID=3156267 RepID=UPI0035165407